MKRVFVNEEWCPGCHLCEYNCAYANSGLSDMVTALKDRRIYPRIRVEDTGRVTCALSCRHCTDPLSVKSCISGAFMTVKDAPALEGAIDREARVLIVGAGIYSGMIRNRTSGDTVDPELPEEAPSLAAFAEETRGKMLGEVV